MPECQAQNRFENIKSIVETLIVFPKYMGIEPRLFLNNCSGDLQFEGPKLRVQEDRKRLTTKEFQQGTCCETHNDNYRQYEVTHFEKF